MYLDVKEKFDFLSSRKYFGEFINDYQQVDSYSPEVKLLIKIPKLEIEKNYSHLKHLTLKELLEEIKNEYIDCDCEIDYEIEYITINNENIIFITNEYNLDLLIEDFEDEIESSFIENRFDDFSHEINYKGCEIF